MSQSLYDQYRQLCKAVVNEQAALIELFGEHGGAGHGVVCILTDGAETLAARPIALLLPADAEPFELAKMVVRKLDPRRN